MKKTILLLFIIQSLFSCAQVNNTEQETVRVQGYLFIQTSLKEDIVSNDGTINIPIDNPKSYFFAPLKSISSSLKETIEALGVPKNSFLYLPLTLTESQKSIEFTNFGLRKFLKDNSIKISQLNENKIFHKKEKTIIKVIGDKVPKRVYEVVYIDGVWEKYKVPFKWTETLSIGRYRSNSLDKNHKDGYDYYFLKDINVISYKLDIKENEITVLGRGDNSMPLTN
ncbi:hypothetical protein [Aquimarina sp. 2304DJ70-9]|uniref:hypothetical protein n=1 Tax=Aquimarina penaris TaxID=3231044 RepID=UPI0034618BC6